MSSAPPGIPAPSGGWHVAFADGFGAPLGGGAGQDPFWETQEGPNCCGNSNEIAAMVRSQVSVGSEGLALNCEPKPSQGKSFSCGEVLSDPHFEFTYGGSDTIVAECFCKWPADTGGADPAFWVYTGSEEIDFFEGWGWANNAGETATWATEGAGMPVITSPYADHVLHPAAGLGFDPSQGFHRYATEIQPALLGFQVSEYIDGVLRWSFTSPIVTSKDGLILVNAMRVSGAGFTAGDRPLVARSIAVYQDGAHAGQGVKGGGIAPGTVMK